nr:MAG TPA_asm: tail tape measure protein [Caudoviricetes sp.]
MPSLKFDAVIETGKVVSGFQDIQNAVHKTAATVESEGKSIDDIINKIQNTVNIAIGGWSIGKFVSQMMQVRGQFQQTEMAFKTMLQSEEKAKDLMQQLINTAAITPFGVDDVTEGAKQLLAFNVAAKDVNDTLIRLGDVAAGMGVSLSEMVMLYGTTIAKGKMDTMDLYQFLNRGIPIADELAKVMGLDVNNAIAEVKEQLTAGKVTSDIFIKAMQNMTSEGSKFGGMMKAQSKTITGQISNIEDAIEQMFNELGRSQEGIINTGLDAVSTIVENWRKVGEVVMVAATAYGTYKAVLMAVSALQVLNNRILQQAVVEKTLAAAAGINLSNAEAVAAARTKFLTLAQQGLTTALKEAAAATLLNPYVLMAAAITSLVYTIYKFSTAASAAEIAQNAWNKSMDEFNRKAEDRKQKIKELVQIIQGADSTSLEKQLAFDELGTVAPELTKVYDSVKKLEDTDLTNFNKQLNEMTGKDREVGLKAQIKQLKEYAKALQDNSASAAAGSARRAAVQGLKDNYGIEAPWSFNKDEKLNDAIFEYMVKLQSELDKIQKAKDELETPTQIDVKLAEEDYKQSKDELDYLSRFALAMKNDIEKKPTNIPFEGRNAEKVIVELEDKVNDLKKEQEEHPIQFTADKKKALDKYQELLGDIKRWKNTAWKQGVFTIPVEIQFKMKQLQDETDKAKGHFNYVTGKYEEANKDESYAAAKKRAKINYQAAVKAEKEARKGSNKDWENAKEDLDAKKKEYEKYWGSISEASSKANKSMTDAKKRAEEQRKAQEELSNALKELVQKNMDDEISIMREGTEKKLKEIDNDYKKRIAEIKKQETEFKKKNKEAGKASSLTKKQSKAISEAKYLASLNKEQKIREVNKEASDKERNDLYEYLKEYGSVQQQKLAITQEYADKIAKAENAYQKASLANQRDNELKKIDASDVFEQIDWENVFADLSSHTKEYLVSLRAQLQSLLKSGKLTDVSDISKVQEKINDINAEISKQGGIFDFIGTKQQENIRRINEAKEAQEALNSAKLQEADIEKQYEEALKQANHKAADLGVRAIGDDTTGIQANIDKAGIDKSTKEYKEMSSILTNLAVLEGKLAKAREKTAKATIEAKDKEDASKKSTTAQIADWFSDAQEFISKSGIDQLPELFSSLGTDESSDKIGQGLSALNDSAGAVADFESGNYIGALTKGISALQGFSNVLGIGADNTAKMQDKIDELNQKNDVLASCLEELNDTLQGTNSITGAQEIYKDAVELINAQKKNASDAMKAEANKHGTWRSSLHSSVNDNKTWKKDMEKVSKILGKTVKSSKDFLSLSPEEMKKIRDTDKDLFMSILNEYRKEGGKGGRSDKLPSMIQDYIDKYADAINDLNEQMSEKYTQMSFDDMKSSFFDALMDMDKDAEDFSDDFSKYLMKSVLNAKIGDLLDKDLKEFYDEWSKLAEDGLSETEIDYLNNKWDTIVNKGLKFRDEASKVTGYTGSSSQTATSGDWQSMGQETADELNGRFTALQIAGESISASMITAVVHMETIISTGISTNGAVTEIRNMMIMTNSYLEDMVKYAKLTYSEFGSKIDDINKRLKEI